MRIDGPKDVGKPSKTSAKGKSNATGQRFIVGGGDQSAGLSGTGGAGSINNIGALLASQVVDGPAAKREGAVRHGSDMLDVLDQLKVGLLSGRVSPQMINRLRTLVAEKGRFAVGGHLEGVLSQIELRAEVELAKLAKQKAKSALSGV